jgi:hypothetical protein
MGGIYQNCIVNAATSAQDSQGGLFFQRDSLLVEPLEVMTRWPLHEKTMPTKLFRMFAQNIWSGVQLQTLNSRGWVLRERILSPRIPHFT